MLEPRFADHIPTCTTSCEQLPLSHPAGGDRSLMLNPSSLHLRPLAVTQAWMRTHLAAGGLAPLPRMHAPRREGCPRFGSAPPFESRMRTPRASRYHPWHGVPGAPPPDRSRPSMAWGGRPRSRHSATPVGSHLHSQESPTRPGGQEARRVMPLRQRGDPGQRAIVVPERTGTGGVAMPAHVSPPGRPAAQPRDLAAPPGMAPGRALIRRSPAHWRCPPVSPFA